MSPEIEGQKNVTKANLRHFSLLFPKTSFTLLQQNTEKKGEKGRKKGEEEEYEGEDESKERE